MLTTASAVGQHVGVDEVVERMGKPPHQTCHRSDLEQLGRHFARMRDGSTVRDLLSSRYEQLAIEGYLVAGQGRSTTVADLPPLAPAEADVNPMGPTSATISDQGNRRSARSPGGVATIDAASHRPTR